MKKRNYIFILVLLLTIGFASVATNLAINGNLNLGFNDKDFDVYFSNVTLNGENKSAEFISSDGKTINFKTNKLSVIGDQATLYYEVTNASREYDAEVRLVCDEFTNDYVSVTNVLNASVIEAQRTGDGVLVAEVLKATVDDKEVSLTCRIEATPTSRDDIAEEENVGNVTTYSLYGYYVDQNGSAIPNADLVVYSDTKHYVRTDNRGYFYVEGLEKGSHEAYYLNNVENIEELSKEEIRAQATSSSVFTTSSGSILFKDNSRIKDLVIELTDNKSYTITLKTSSDVVVTEEYEVTQNKPYGLLPTVDVINSSFIHWTLEDGTVVTNDSLVAEDKPHTLIAVISPVVAPVIEASNTNWTDQNVTVSIKTPGVAEKGINTYEYLITTSENPSSEETPTGTTSGNVTITNVGVNNVYYRTVATDGVKSGWSNKVVTKIDKTAPTNVSFSNKAINSGNVTMNVNYTENESNITTTKCYYGDASSQTRSGTANNGTCVYPISAEYAKVCVVNSVGKETCSDAKQLSEYFIKNGVPLVKFETYTPNTGEVSLKTVGTSYQLNVGSTTTNSGRGGAISKQKYDFDKYPYGYVDFDLNYKVHDVCAPHNFIAVSKCVFFDSVTCEQAVYGEFQSQPPLGDYSVNRKVVYINAKDYTDSYLLFGKNSSSQYATFNIYNIWFQLSE